MSNELWVPLQNDEEKRESRYSFHRTLEPLEIEGMTKTETCRQAHHISNTRGKVQIIDCLLLYDIFGFFYGQ